MNSEDRTLTIISTVGLSLISVTAVLLLMLARSCDMHNNCMQVCKGAAIDSTRVDCIKSCRGEGQ